MRKSLLWTLAATGTASAVALWLAPDDGRVVAGVPATVTPGQDRYAPWREAPNPASAASAPPRPLPTRLAERDSEAGSRDIFVPVLPAQPPPPPPASPTPPPPPPPPPMPPPMNWRAVGAMVAPAGERTVWLARGAEELAVMAGMALEDGYVVQSIDDDAVVLVYPPLGTSARIALPRAP